MTDEELQKLLEQITDEQIADVVSGLLFPGLKIAVDHGVSPLKAMRALLAHFLEESLGTGVWKELGVPTRTVERWRREVREALQAAPELLQEEPPVEVFQTYLRLKAEKMAKDQKKAAS